MTFDEALALALESDAPLREARSVVESFLRQGQEKQALLDRLERIRQKFREKGREPEEDVVMDVMEFVLGWCSPHMRIDVADQT